MAERKPHILVTEDERLIQEFLSHTLASEGYEISCFENGGDMLNAFDPDVHDLLLLDLHLPDESGIVLTRQIRARSRIPIIILTSDTDHSTRINLLSMGVDDFLLKSVSGDELRYRIRNLLDRTYRNTDREMTDNTDLLVNGWRLNTDTLSVHHSDGREVSLTLYEFRTLELLAQAGGRVLTRGQVLDGLSNDIDGPSDRMVDAYISRIRTKLESEDVILTVKGVGYRANM